MFVVLETFGIDWQLLIAQGVNFLILAGLLTWLLYKPVLRIVKERQAFVAKGVEDAERAAKKLAPSAPASGKKPRSEPCLYRRIRKPEPERPRRRRSATARKR